MGNKLYVGNLSFGMSEEALADIFAAYGEVQSARIITDRESGRSKGFAFVEMTNENDAQTAIEKLNGTEQMGRAMNVSEAKPQAPRESRGGFGGGRGGGGGGGFRGGNSNRSRY